MAVIKVITLGRLNNYEPDDVQFNPSSCMAGVGGGGIYVLYDITQSMSK